MSEGFPGRAGATRGDAVGVVVNRDRTAVIGVGGTRLGAIVAIAALGAWAAPRLPKSAVVATTGLVAVAALHRSRLRRLVWLTTTLRRDAPDAILVGEFAAREPGAGVAFAAEVLDAIGTRVTLALTVQGTRGGRRPRSLVRLYERLQFETVARHSVGDDDVVLMVRRASREAAAKPVPSVS